MNAPQMPGGGGGLGRGPRSGSVAGKGHITRAILLRLWRYLSRHRWMLIVALLLSVGSNLLALVGPTLSGLAIDAIEPGKGAVVFARVFYYCGWMAAFYLVSSALQYVLSVLMIHLSQRVSYQMRKDIFEKLMDLPVSFFDSHQTGDLISRINYDIDTVNASLSNDLVQIATSIITVSGSLVMMLAISPMLSLVFAVTVPISFLITRYVARRIQPLFRKRSQKLGEMNGFVEEIISGQKTIKAYHQEDTMLARFDEKNVEAVDAYYEADYYGAMMGPSVNFINNLSLTFVSVFGALMYLGGSLSLGNVSSFVLYSRKFSGPINEAANILGELQSAAAAAERVFRLLDEAPEPDDAPNAHVFHNVHGQVDINDICFSYVPDVPVLKHLSLGAAPGSLVAIVGHTGAGKTTLINLLMRFYDPDSGHIDLDGTNIRKATRASLRASWAMVLQDTWLFGGTVYDNIAYGKPDATMEDVIAAAKAAHMHGTIMRLPQGYQTPLNEDGVNISQGQRQLLTIARAMLLDARMLILDEATSNVDTRTELRIQQAMRQLMAGKTCFVIAHRLSTIVNADTILVMQNGDVVEQGTHQSLMDKGGVYAELFNSQFEN